MRGIHRWPVDSPPKRPVTRKMFPFDDVIIESLNWSSSVKSFLKGNFDLLSRNNSLCKKCSDSVYVCCDVKLFVDFHTGYINPRLIKWRYFSFGDAYIRQYSGSSLVQKMSLSEVIIWTNDGSLLIGNTWRIYDTVRYRYNTVNFLQNPHNKHPQLTGRDISVCCDSKIFFTFCHCFCSTVCNIAMNWTAFERHTTVHVWVN